jgi:glycosyltransferase involved in cell wall biosynthesis
MSGNIPRISIGIPVYNGEKFIKRRLENILTQTYQDFEIEIYDNSDDSTTDICKDYLKKDKRIHYQHEPERSGWIQGWINVIKKAKFEYFVVAEVDDLWSANFLEENIRELDTFSSAVSSIGTLEFLSNPNSLISKKSNGRSNLRKFKTFLSQNFFTHSFQPTFEAKGFFEKKATDILRNTWYRHHNGVMRSIALSKSLIEKDMFLWDWSIVLNLIKYGDLHIAKKSTYRIYTGDSVSRQGIFTLFKSQNTRFNEYLFPASTFSFWCINNIGIKFFLKNIDYFIWLNFIHEIGLFSGLYRKLSN